MAIHSSTLAWEIPRTEEPGGLQTMGSQSRTRLSNTHTHTHTHTHPHTYAHTYICVFIKRLHNWWEQGAAAFSDNRGDDSSLLGLRVGLGLLRASSLPSAWHALSQLILRTKLQD